MECCISRGGSLNYLRKYDFKSDAFLRLKVYFFVLGFTDELVESILFPRRQNARRFVGRLQFWPSLTYLNISQTLPSHATSHLERAMSVVPSS
jgi:hypothetical protein